MTLAAPKSRRGKLTLAVAVVAALAAVAVAMLWISMARANLPITTNTTNITTSSPKAHGTIVGLFYDTHWTTNAAVTPANEDLIMEITGIDTANLIDDGGGALTAANVACFGGSDNETNTASFSGTTATCTVNEPDVGEFVDADTSWSIHLINVMVLQGGNNVVDAATTRICSDAVGGSGCSNEASSNIVALSTASVVVTLASVTGPPDAVNFIGANHTFIWSLPAGFTCGSDINNDAVRDCAPGDITLSANTAGATVVSGPTVTGTVLASSGTVSVTVNGTTAGSVTVTLALRYEGDPAAAADDLDTADDAAIKTYTLPIVPTSVISIPDPDHWNVIGSDHELCLDPASNAPIVILGVTTQNQFGANATQSGSAFTDGGRTCVNIRSNTPGETTGATINFRFNTGLLALDALQFSASGNFIKEWSKLTDSVIIRVPASWSGVDDQGIPPTPDSFTANDHIDDIDWQDANDIQGTTITADKNTTIRIIEISRGEHQTAFGPFESYGIKVDATGLAHVDVDHADVSVVVTSPRNCTSATFVSDGHSVTSHVHSSGEVESKQIVGTTTRTLDHGGEEIAISATCEELATITITEAYPNPVSSAFNKVTQFIKVNWTTVEEAKQPVIRKAGEEIVLEKFIPNPGEFSSCSSFISDATFVELGGPGALIRNTDWGELFGGDEFDATPIALRDPDTEDLIGCFLNALYSSEDPGQVDVELSWFDEDGSLNKHPFLVWYVKLYSVNVSNVAGSFTGSDLNGDGFIDATEGSWSPAPTVWDSAGTDVRDETRVVSDYSLIRVQVKDYLYLSNPSGRGDVCLDMDGDGTGAADRDTSLDGKPYATTTHLGCPDPNDEALAGGHWVLPDDFEILAGAQPDLMRKSWDVLCGPGDTACSGAGLIGPKRLVDSHDGVLRDWVTYDTTATYKVIDGGIDVNNDKVVDGDDDGFVCDAAIIDGQVDVNQSGTITTADDSAAGSGHTSTNRGLDCDHDGTNDFQVINGGVDIVDGTDDINTADDGTLTDTDFITYKSIAPNGVVNIWDAIMPLEKLTLSITGSGTLFAVDKDAVYGANNPYFRVFVPAHDAIPAVVSNGGYDWDSTFMGPYSFWDALQFLTLDSHGHVKKMQVYTDNRGEGMALLYGDADLTFADCGTNISGAPDCEPGDVVGTTTVGAIADYPYFRKHRDIQGNTVTKTWEWGGYKRVTVVPLDPTHTYVVAHLLDRDGECTTHWGAGSSGVRHEPVLFQISSEGVIDAISNVHDSAFLGILPFRAASVTAGNATDFGGTLPFDNAGSPDECQAYILVQHGSSAKVQVSIEFPEPEGLLIRSVQFPLADVLWGDVDCDGDVDIGDAQKIARWLINLPITQTEPCPDIGSSVSVTEGATTTIRKWGDVDGDGDVDIGDAQKIARWLINLSITQEPGTPAIGDTVAILT